ncbi:MAG: AmmeMemoRadiSam system radical SAM enzyme [Bacteroidetes bacterium]|nr:AmmeMemoRadiSam system radical SAM enzyme [Bacteroidota bacterium]
MESWASGLLKSDPAGPADDKLWKWSREAVFYAPTARGIKCTLCPNMCNLREGETSICRTRVVNGGKLHTIAYGNPCSVHVDPIEKKPLYHFLPGSRSYSIATAGCNFACRYCQNWEISQVSPKDTRNDDLMPQKVVEEAITGKCTTIAYTYSEPVIFYEYMYDTARIARSKGVKNLMISNGFINEKPLQMLCQHIDAANIDLKAFTDDIYSRLCGGSLNPVQNTLKILKSEQVWFEITCLIVPGWNDDMQHIALMCDWLLANGLESYPLHFSRFHPMYKLVRLPATPLTTLEKARNIALIKGMKYVYIGNVPGSGYENTVCHYCKKTLIERKGFTIISNHISGSACKFCKTKIPGVWG